MTLALSQLHRRPSGAWRLRGAGWWSSAVEELRSKGGVEKWSAGALERWGGGVVHTMNGGLDERYHCD